ncbi:N-acetylglucosamine-6-phosphate deacetylase [Temperatibacter marinus]|uniref:N-acetylglucosamine-6-phosphate deacetylase n=1 Tax=Temperatibacter marinus TaxID=1456591 RepID=A0AA52EL86_9PROT|nr:N-acetylglucosamine-6-phosphate deacetylase [Temperatibacter marinus]WND04076.1 N-acetylglucosamine-6-phosphate deacetylase [Temperatibacter marinus]
MRTLLHNATLLTPQGKVEGHDLLIEGEYIKALESDISCEGITQIDCKGDLLIPGFIDVQVNGGGGALFNADPSVETIKTIGAAHRIYGTSAFLPTLISDTLETVKKAISAVEAAIEQGVPGVIGIHLEGPFLNPVKKGIHNADKFRVLDDEAVEVLTSLSKGVTHITLAPEQTTPQMVEKLVARGAVLSAGHTAATYEQMMQAVDAGVTGFTHLYNAMTGLDSRAPGVVGAALTTPATYAGIISDGFHVHPASIEAAIKAKGISKMMLVSDAMPCVGAVNKSFTLEGLEITVEEGKCTGPDGTLAGSDLDMISAVRNTAAWTSVTYEESVYMASKTPADFLGVSDQYGSLEVGKKANILQIDAAGKVVSNWINGKL